MERIEADEFIDSSEVSVVIQGLTLYENNGHSLFHQCINSLRLLLPDAEIIVSTWKGQPCDPDMVDMIIYNDEPPVITSLMGRTWNFNKMLLSTYNGLKKASRKYTLKFRADLCLSSTDFLLKTKHYKLPQPLKHYCLTEEPIVLTNLYIRNPASYAHLLFHPSDIVQFGLTTDLLDLWCSVPVTQEQVIVPLRWWSGFYYPYGTGERMVPEQALMIDWLHRKGYNINLPYSGYISAKYCKLSEIILSTNFYIIDWQKSGIVFPKRFTNDQKTLDETLYKAKTLNQLTARYSEDFFSQRRYLEIVWHVYIVKFFSINSWISFIAAFLLWLSPKLFFSTRSLWRRLNINRVK